MRKEYSIQRPAYPVSARALALVLVIGLIGLGLVAFEVFSLIDGPIVAGAFALVIELAAISEAMSILKRNKPAWVGLAISLLVSGLYNYTRAAQANELLTTQLGQVELIALAIGPLSAVLFLALSLGHAVKEYEAAVEAWERERQSWADAQAQADAQAEAARQAAAQAHALELAKIQAEQAARVQLAQIRADARAARAVAQPAAQPTVQVAQPAHAAARGDYAAFKVAQSARNGAGPMHYAEVMSKFNVSRRTAYSWLEKYAAETLEQAAQPVTNN
jgi:hypothetical protein